MSLARYILQRFLLSIPLLLFVIIVNFVLIHSAPGDPVRSLTGEFPVPEENIERMKKKYGLDKPVAHQLLIYIKNIAKGDLGYSFRNRAPVIKIIGEKVWATILLAASALLFSSFLGVFLGMAAARRSGTVLDNSIVAVSLVGYSIPVFWLGQIMIIVFAIFLGWLPAQGMKSTHLLGESGWPVIVNVGKHLILPMLALSFRYLALNARITRSTMLEIIGKEFIVTAYAKGLTDRIVWLRHILRNALVVVITIIGFNFGFLLFGSVVVETVFAWPGIGRLLFESISGRDYPVILGIFLLACIFVIIINLITDIIYAYLDPRIRYE